MSESSPTPLQHTHPQPLTPEMYENAKNYKTKKLQKQIPRAVILKKEHPEGGIDTPAY